MIRISQRYSAEVDENGLVFEGSQRGDCVAACLASIFEMPIDTFPEHDDTQWLWRWLAVYFPGVDLQHKHFGRPTDEAPYHRGFWLATIESSRFKEHCTDCSVDLAESTSFFWKRDECPWCRGTGIRPGFHCVVMENRDRVWDPHPGVDWDAPLSFAGEKTFHVKDVARLTPRVMPAPFGAVAV